MFSPSPAASLQSSVAIVNKSADKNLKSYNQTNTLQEVANNSAQVRQLAKLQDLADSSCVIQRVVLPGLAAGTQVVGNTDLIVGRRGIILEEVQDGRYLVKFTPGPRMKLSYSSLDLAPSQLEPELIDDRDRNEDFKEQESVSIGAVAEKESGQSFRWPKVLWDKKISKESNKAVIDGNVVDFKYSETSALSFQPAGGREMRSKDVLVEKGAWKNEEVRKNYVLSIDGGTIKDAKGKTMNGNIQYVLSEDWVLYGQDTFGLEAEKTKYGRKSDVHTRYLAGGPVRCAGWIVASSGSIKRVGNDSGHYGPTKYMLYQLLTLLRDGGVDLNGVLFHDQSAGKAYNALNMYNWMKNGENGKEPKGVESKGL